MRLLPIMSAALLMSSVACHKTQLATAPTTPPSPPAMPEVVAKPETRAPGITGADRLDVGSRPVVAGFTLEPSAVEPGQSVKLRWTVLGASDVRITPDIGEVGPVGERSVRPANTTSYTLTARGPKGEVSALAVVRMIQVPSLFGGAIPEPLERILKTEVVDVYFDYNSAELTEESRQNIERAAYALRKLLSSEPQGRVILEGHCDERGSAEYNFGLGDRRANVVKEFLAEFGIPSERLSVASWGKEYPQCAEATEDCWRRNRRVHFTAASRPASQQP